MFAFIKKQFVNDRYLGRHATVLRFVTHFHDIGRSVFSWLRIYCCTFLISPLRILLSHHDGSLGILTYRYWLQKFLFEERHDNFFCCLVIAAYRFSNSLYACRNSETQLLKVFTAFSRGTLPGKQIRG